MFISFEDLDVSQVKELISLLIQVNDVQVDEALMQASIYSDALAGHELDRVYVAQGLSIHGLERIVELLERVSANDDFKRSILCDAVGLTGNSAGIEILVDEFLKGGEKTRLWGALALSKMGSDAIIPIRELLPKFEANSTRLILINALSRIGTFEALAVVEEFLNNLKSEDAETLRRFLQ